MPRNASVLPLVLGVFAVSGLAQVKFVPTPGALPAGVKGVPYEQTISVSPVAGTVSSVTYQISSGALPGGLTFKAASSTTASISGTPTTAGTSSFTITFLATTSNGVFSGSGPYSITIGNPVQITASPASLNFVQPLGGSAPSEQYVYVLSGGASTGFTASLDDGNGGPSPFGFTAYPPKATTPARIHLFFDDHSATSIGTRSARLLLSVPGASPVTIPLTASLVERPASFFVFPERVHMRKPHGSTAKRHQTLFVSNSGGGGPRHFTASLFNPFFNPVFTVTPLSGQTSPNGPALIDLTYDPVKDPTGKQWWDAVFLQSDAGSAMVPIAVTEDQNGPFLDVPQSGLLFTSQVGSTPQRKTFTIFNSGEAGSTLHFTTTKMAPGRDFASFSGGTIVGTGSGSVTPGSPTAIDVFATPASTSGIESEVFRITTPDNPADPRYVVVNEVTTPKTTSDPSLDLSPKSLNFVVTRGDPLQTMKVQLTADSSIGYTTAFNANDGGNWGSVTPLGGTASATFGPTLTFTLNPSALTAGVHIGEINVLWGSAKQLELPVTAVVREASGPTTAGPMQARASAACTPTRVVVAPAVLGSFSRPQGLPELLSADLYDDCGNALSGADNTVVATLDNGDAPVVLSYYGPAAGQGSYLATWTPLSAQANVNITFMAASGNLTPGTAVVNGTVTANQFKLPVLFDGGTVNNTNPLGGPVLAPGTVTSIYGMNLAANASSPGVIPLPNTVNGTNVKIGGGDAPFYYLGGGQLNVQAPADLVPGQQAAVVVQVNSAFAVLPNGISVFPATPGVSAFADGHIIAQHGDFTLIDAAHPAKPNEPIVIYLSGMGATTPSVATGQPASATDLTPAQIQPTVTVAGQTASVGYAGLTPGGIGLYQINFTVPAGLAPGDAEVLVTQSGFTANRSLLPIGTP